MKRIIGIGETVLDIIFRGDQPVSAVPGGSTFNSMISLGRAGANCLFISETGDDRVGDVIVEFLRVNHVDNSMVQRNKGMKSPLSLAFLDEKNNADYVFYKDHEHDAIVFKYPTIEEGDLVLFGSFYSINPVIRKEVGGFLRYAREQGAILYYDVNFRRSHQHEIEQILPNLEENIRLAHIVRGSDEDFQILFGLSSIASVSQRLAEIRGEHQGSLIYTRGEKPVQVITSNNEQIEYAFSPIQPVSTIGAGDNFNAGFLYELYRSGMSLQDVECGLNTDEWKQCLAMGVRFSTACCQSIYNYIPEGQVER